jgi:hypothetical protein
VETADDARFNFLTAPQLAERPYSSVIKANKGYDEAQALEPDGLLRFPWQGEHAKTVLPTL